MHDLETFSYQKKFFFPDNCNSADGTDWLAAAAPDENNLYSAQTKLILALAFLCKEKNRAGRLSEGAMLKEN